MNRKIFAVILSCLFPPMLAFGASPAEGTLQQIITEFMHPLHVGNRAGSVSDPANASFFCYNDELTIWQIENTLLSSMARAIRAGDRKALQESGLRRIAGLAWTEKPARERDGIQEFHWRADAKEQAVAEYLDKFSRIEYANFKVADYFIAPENRIEHGEFHKTVVRLRLDVRGYDRNEKARQDVAELMAEIVNVGNKWQVKQIDVKQGLSLVQTRKPAFTEITNESGIQQANVYLRTEAIRRGGYALSVTDVNQDGNLDVFIGMREAPELWLGSKDGKFSRIGQTGFSQERYSKTAAFSDFDNDGDQDLVLTRFQPLKVQGPPVEVVVYENKDGAFAKKNTSFLGFKMLREPMPAAVADFNGDGYLDFYVGYPGVQDFSQLSVSEVRPLREVQGLYLNDGKGGFVNFTEKAFVKERFGDYTGRLFPHSSAALDLDQDGDQDLIVADDRGNLSPLFVNQGKGKFVEAAREAGIENFGYAMSLAAGDINNDGKTELALTNVYLSEFDRNRTSCRRHFATQPLAGPTARGLRLFSEKKQGAFQELLPEAFANPGEATGGLTFLDYNNDGWLDLYVVNGLWSGTTEGQDFGAFFATAITGRGDLLYALRSSDKFHFMDLLREFKGRLASYGDANSVTSGSERPSLGGFQRNRLFRNNGDGTFTDVGFLEGVDSIADGYIAARADLNGDGKMDLFLRNADPGTEENRFPVVQIFKNQYENGNKSVVLSFVGSKSNRDAFGLFAKAFSGKSVQVQHLVANSGSVQEQRILHFGLGKRDSLDRLEIHWPSGRIQTLRKVKAGFHQISEPESSVHIGAKPQKKSRSLSQEGG